MQSFAVIVSVVALGFSGQIAGARQALDSGVKGKVLYGPTCPVQRVGETCVRPYRAKFRVLNQSTRAVVATTRSGADGRQREQDSGSIWLVPFASRGRVVGITSPPAATNGVQFIETTGIDGISASSSRKWSPASRFGSTVLF